MAIQRPVTVAVSLLAILVIGFIAFQQIPIELLPTGFRAPYLGVWIPYRNIHCKVVYRRHISGSPIMLPVHGIDIHYV